MIDLDASFLVSTSGLCEEYCIKVQSCSDPNLDPEESTSNCTVGHATVAESAQKLSTSCIAEPTSTSASTSFLNV